MEVLHNKAAETLNKTGFIIVWFTFWSVPLYLLEVNMPSVSPLCRHTAVLVESIKKGIRDADSEARVEARK